MNKIRGTRQATDEIVHKCDHCKAIFKREESLIKHSCEKKRRYQLKDVPSNRIAFLAWLEFYRISTASKKIKTYTEFINSNYYLAFARFGAYCAQTKVLNPVKFTGWLLEHKVRIDDWTKDSHYTKYLIDFVRNEDCFDALERSVKTSIELAELYEIQPHDCFRLANKNRICMNITNGKISPWMLYHSKSGIEFLEALDIGNQKAVLDYIDPEKWAVKFIKYKSEVQTIKQILDDGGY